MKYIVEKFEDLNVASTEATEYDRICINGNDGNIYRFRVTPGNQINNPTKDMIFQFEGTEPIA